MAPRLPMAPLQDHANTLTVAASDEPVETSPVDRCVGRLDAGPGTMLPLGEAVVYIEESDSHDRERIRMDSSALVHSGPGMYRVAVFHPSLGEMGWSEPPTQLVIVPPGSDVQVDFIIDRDGILIEPGGFGTADDPFFLDPLTIVGKRSVFERPTEEGARVDYVDSDGVRAREGDARHIGDLLRVFPSLRVFEPRPGMVCISTSRRTTETPNPGSQLGRFDETGAAGVNLERLCPKMVQVYIDDVAVHRPEEIIGTISPQNIERVEYVNGVAAGARFGTGYAEGVLLLYTRAPTLSGKRR